MVATARHLTALTRQLGIIYPLQGTVSHLDG